MSEELKAIFPVKKITVAEMPFEIKPFTFGQLPKVMKLMEKVAGPVQTAYKEGKSSDPATIMGIFATGGEDLIELMADAIKAPKEFVSNLDSDEGIKLLVTFIEVNKDFFIQRILPLIKDKFKIDLNGQT